ncbi:hypothetical protein [uncultured Anaerofustis sp.]|uniref:hypothetical protein n=1 Tax=uncultured Anaerofustis sp. TaxID=904996 RepID=UPI0025E8DE7C|nr:hypothetical protein [uncultured Anaerofustis sp.]
MVRKGRPTNDPKTNRMEVRLSDADINYLDFCCKKLNKTKAEIIRLGIKLVYEKEK